MSERERSLMGPRALKERGSPDWCWQTVSYLQDYMRHVSNEWKRAQEVLDDLITVRAWEVIPPDQPYGTLNRMLREEIGLDERAIKAAIRQAELAALGANYSPEDARFVRTDNISTGQYGTDQTYTIRRLNRDRPDLAALVEQRVISANEAAIRAGFRKRSMSIPADDAQRAYERLCGKYGWKDREQLELLAKLLWHHLHPEAPDES